MMTVTQWAALRGTTKARFTLTILSFSSSNLANKSVLHNENIIQRTYLAVLHAKEVVKEVQCLDFF